MLRTVRLSKLLLTACALFGFGCFEDSPSLMPTGAVDTTTGTIETTGETGRGSASTTGTSTTGSTGTMSTGALDSATDVVTVGSVGRTGSGGATTGTGEAHTSETSSSEESSGGMLKRCDGDGWFLGFGGGESLECTGEPQQFVPPGPISFDLEAYDGDCVTVALPCQGRTGAADGVLSMQLAKLSINLRTLPCIPAQIEVDVFTFETLSLVTFVDREGVALETQEIVRTDQDPGFVTARFEIDRDRPPGALVVSGCRTEVQAVRVLTAP